MKNTDGIGEPALPRARGELSKLLHKARDKFSHDTKVLAFLDRLADGGDLRKPLEDDVAQRVEGSMSSQRIAGEVLACVDQLWRKSPPSPTDLLEKLFNRH